MLFGDCPVRPPSTVIVTTFAVELPFFAGVVLGILSVALLVLFALLLAADVVLPPLLHAVKVKLVANVEMIRSFFIWCSLFQAIKSYASWR